MFGYSHKAAQKATITYSEEDKNKFLKPLEKEAMAESDAVRFHYYDKIGIFNRISEKGKMPELTKAEFEINNTR